MQCKGHRFDPRSGKIPHASEQLSKLKLLKPRACAPQQEKPPQQEACTPPRGAAPARCKQRKAVCNNKDPSQPHTPARNDQPKIILITQRCSLGASLVVQWLKLCTHKAGGPGLIPGQGTRSFMLQLRLSTAKQVSKYFLEKKPKERYTLWGGIFVPLEYLCLYL